MERRLAVIASGTGSNFAALADAAAAGILGDAKIVGLIVDSETAGARQKARDRQIEHVFIAHKVHPSAEAFDGALTSQLERWNADWICLAGFLRILGPGFVSRWRNRVVNVHPSLLPAFPGLHGAKQALDAGVKETGCTVHLVIEGLDAGPVVLQNKLPVLPNDTEATLLERLHPIEHRTYVEAMRMLLERPFAVVDNRIVWT